MTPAELAAAILDADSSTLHAEVAAILGLDADAPMHPALLTHLIGNADRRDADTIERLCAVWHDGFIAGLIASDTEMSEMFPCSFMDAADA